MKLTLLFLLFSPVLTVTINSEKVQMPAVEAIFVVLLRKSNTSVNPFLFLFETVSLSSEQEH